MVVLGRLLFEVEAVWFGGHLPIYLHMVLTEKVLQKYMLLLLQNSSLMALGQMFASNSCGLIVTAWLAKHFRGELKQ
jgi:hypothetical protein